MLQHYPSISASEFEEACKALEERCYDRLSGTNWLGVKWHDGELEIKQASGVPPANGLKEALKVEKGVEAEDDDSDMDAVVRQPPASQDSGPISNRPAVDFSILLSPTYRVPVLWFTLSTTKIARIEDLEEIYSRVVEPGSHESLRGIGIMGGISLANHPVTDIPTFFVHPCNTPEAMVALNDGSKLDPFQYLLLWFGIAATGIGLHVPSKVAASPS